MTVTCSRPSCGAAADDAETALSLRWQHPREGYWVCPACDALDGGATAELLASTAVSRAARERGR